MHNLNAKLFSAVRATLQNVPMPLPAVADASKCDALRPNATGKTEKRATNPNVKESLSPRQLSAAAMLVSGQSAISVAKSLGVHKATLFRWKNSPAFINEVNRRVNQLHGMTQKSVASIPPRRCPELPAPQKQSELVRTLLAEMEAARMR